jgi:2,4-dienoyl-CoA reductase (NADPH2)
VELAEFLASRGRRVHLVAGGTKLVPEVGKKRRNEHMDRLDRLRITVNTAVEIRRIENGGVVVSAGGMERRIPGDSIIVAGTPLAEASMAETLQAAGLKVYPIGDSNVVGLIAGATASALDAVAQVGVDKV